MTGLQPAAELLVVPRPEGRGSVPNCRPVGTVVDYCSGSQYRSPEVQDHLRRRRRGRRRRDAWPGPTSVWSRRRDAYAVRVGQQPHHHPWVVRLAPANVLLQMHIHDRRQVQRLHHVQNAAGAAQWTWGLLREVVDRQPGTARQPCQHLRADPFRLVEGEDQPPAIRVPQDAVATGAPNLEESGTRERPQDAAGGQLWRARHAGISSRRRATGGSGVGDSPAATIWWMTSQASLRTAASAVAREAP